jgi:small nuclear ribonucleoprotein (snRNP)-like protein
MLLRRTPAVLHCQLKQNTVWRADKVLVITSDGRCYVGVLKACDQTTNIVLEETVERIYSEEVLTMHLATKPITCTKTCLPE